LEASNKNPPRKPKDETSHQSIVKIHAVQRCIAAGLEAALSNLLMLKYFSPGCEESTCPNESIPHPAGVQ
jgi:hypothetical protein